MSTQRNRLAFFFLPVKAPLRSVSLHPPRRPSLSAGRCPGSPVATDIQASPEPAGLPRLLLLFPSPAAGCWQQHGAAAHTEPRLLPFGLPCLRSLNLPCTDVIFVSSTISFLFFPFADLPFAW
ncbi:hypothetical protein BS78_04G040200 [Paspalum vaginatum]|nr:hypothetical protein BS78_04G040200 [Paspalum vaginatum]